jgi:hypothetical protein
MNKNQIKDEQIWQDANDWEHQMEETQRFLAEILRETRGMPGLGIRTIADTIKVIFDKAEIETLTKELCINKAQNKNQ